MIFLTIEDRIFIMELARGSLQDENSDPSCKKYHSLAHVSKNLYVYIDDAKKCHTSRDRKGWISLMMKQIDETRDFQYHVSPYVPDETHPDSRELTIETIHDHFTCDDQGQ